MEKLTEEERNRLIAGIAEYKHEREVIKRVLKRHKRLSANEFDRIFGDSKFVITKTGEKIEVRRRPRFRFMGSWGQTFILGGLFTSASDLSKWLELTQTMCKLDIVSVHVEGAGLEKIYYSLK